MVKEFFQGNLSADTPRTIHEIEDTMRQNFVVFS